MVGGIKLEGITILNTINNPIYGFTWSYPAIIIAIFFVLVIGFIIFVAIKAGDLSILSAILIICLFGPAIVVIAGQTEIDSYITYEVLIDDDISLTKFNEAYEIISQRGEIYKIKERSSTDTN